MKKLLLSSFLLASTLIFAQTKHTVIIENFSFTPANLLISQGDTVVFDNVQGFHSIDGSQSTYPLNPEGFSNANASAPWTFTHVFNTAGDYDYRCGVHTGSMFGTITVNTSTSVKETTSLSSNSYPNPTTGVIYLSKNKTYTQIEVLNNIGKVVLTKNFPQGNIDVTKLATGTYFMRLYTKEGSTTEKIIVQ
ncbi:T9SS type A sorting domain-containing protein [Vicingus serpentipes]|uniref:T9SS type A sorting domain-containing protein n=1 Tax=Vicingus serpentipes TaxID=1926625 RepID=A0A5C6RQP9_9FLAO|nr:T9SS type A sorting domain-containing protein [Vicingus serpentipes]TXB64339.1 T9SS type A sorting domain-containing protein [Vicingus serpentipes]